MKDQQKFNILGKFKKQKKEDKKKLDDKRSHFMQILSSDKEKNEQRSKQLKKK